VARAPIPVQAWHPIAAGLSIAELRVPVVSGQAADGSVSRAVNMAHTTFPVPFVM
jgi:hypothetical protein